MYGVKMNILVSFLVLFFLNLNENVSCTGSDTSPTNNRQFTPEAIFHLLSEQVRNLIMNGDADNGVPVLDPYEFQWREKNFASGEKLNATVNITDGKFTGLSDYRLQKINFTKSEISVEVNIDVPSLKFYSEFYELDGTIYDAIPIKGRGIADIEIQNLSLWGKLYLKQSTDGKSILLDKIENPEFTVERIVSRTQFDDNIDNVISSMVEDLLAEYLTRFNKYIASTYSGYIPSYLNPTMENYDNWNLLVPLLYDYDF